MKVTCALYGEHGVLHGMFDHVGRLLPWLGTVAEAHGVVELTASAILEHSRLEDQILLPALQARLGPNGPLAVMRTEHADLEAELSRARAATTRDEAVAHLRAALDLARTHFHKEELVLFRLATEVLPEDELERLGEEWARLRAVHLGVAPRPFPVRRAG